MTVKIYDSLPKEAIDIRTEVFVSEQGFVDKPDEADKIATHIVMFDGDRAVATCRILKTDTPSTFLIGRIAVLKSLRGNGLGRKIMEEAEKYLRSIGADAAVIHSQLRARDFYVKCGYTVCSEIEYEQNYPHVWVRKSLNEVEK